MRRRRSRKVRARTDIQALDGDVFVMSTVMSAPTVVTTASQLRLSSSAVKVVKPDWSTSSAVSVAE